MRSLGYGVGCDIYAWGVVLWQLSEVGKPIHGEAPVVRATEIPSEYGCVVAVCVAPRGYNMLW